MHAALQAMLTSTVVYRAYTGQDSYGAPTYGPPLPRPARLEYVPRRIVTAQGQEMASRGRIFLDAARDIDLRDQLTLPDGTTPPLLSIAVVLELDGSTSHYEVAI